MMKNEGCGALQRQNGKGEIMVQCDDVYLCTKLEIGLVFSMK